MSKLDKVVEIKLKSGKTLKFNNETFTSFEGHPSTHQLESDDFMFTIVEKSTTNREWIESCISNTDHESPNFVVSEYIGSESQSENWTPDIEDESVTDSEIYEVLFQLEILRSKG